MKFAYLFACVVPLVQATTVCSLSASLTWPKHFASPPYDVTPWPYRTTSLCIRSQKYLSIQPCKQQLFIAFLDNIEGTFERFVYKFPGNTASVLFMQILQNERRKFCSVNSFIYLYYIELTLFDLYLEMRLPSFILNVNSHTLTEVKFEKYKYFKGSNIYL